MRLESGNVAAFQRDTTGSYWQHSHEAFQQGRLADTIATQQRQTFAFLDIERHPAQGMCSAIILVELIDLQHGLASQINFDYAFVGLHLLHGTFGQYRTFMQHGDLATLGNFLDKAHVMLHHHDRMLTA